MILRVKWTRRATPTARRVALDLAGAARAATLSSTSPLFAAPAAVVFLGERLTPRIVVGTVLAVVGIALLA